ncbi:NUDIX domain-containing protein [Mobilitalea sibirica]|uniref:NUDIX domain-containing protein n=1 Tax=Mobilitalea sibirica TaxID=1462919 RepID=A0A8J7KVC1_9FIRM|nr:NUDIX domain-containing protein [Mobilitalea sibirica]MBH1939985.1 NUDIX domain-containing protein [Mobilitalea sibirica]
MLEVKFYENIEDELLEFAVIVSRYHSKWVFCTHRERNTYEVPGGHREPGETILETAKRELYEETGAVEYSLYPVCVYSVKGKEQEIEGSKETYGMLYFAEVSRFEELPDYEIEKVVFLDELPSNLTYPFIQPKLMEKVIQFLYKFIK